MTAPVTLVTGLPGNGKTLYTLCMVKEWAEKENRQVYYNGIEILDKKALPWEEIKAEDWHTVPAGSIIVLDEAHKVFPTRPVGSKTPDHVLPIAELRHEGHNLVLITQHPMELDSAVRRRVGRHLHAVRRFGAQACALFEWSSVKDNCDKTRKDAIRHEWKYSKAAYAWYKSAEVHTIKRKIPMKVWLLLVVPPMLAGAIYSVVHIFTKQRQGESVVVGVAGAASEPVIGGGGGGHVRTRADWLADQQPRVEGLAYTAPAYDQVTQPVRAPYPAACVMTKARCGCYTQQGTRLAVPQQLCQQIAEGGFFIAWDEKGQGQGQGREQAQPVQPARAMAEPLPGVINVTPGYTPAQVRSIADQVADGQNFRHGKNNRIPG